MKNINITFRVAIIIITGFLLAVVAVGAVYDLEEFWESFFLHNNRYLGGSVELIDITLDCLGALTAILIFWTVLFLVTPRIITSPNS